MAKANGRPRIYPFDRLDVGESFTIPLRDWNHRQSIAVAAIIYGKRNNRRFRTITGKAGILEVTRVA